MNIKDPLFKSKSINIISIVINSMLDFKFVFDNSIYNTNMFKYSKNNVIP